MYLMMFACGILFGLGHSIAPYIILKMKLHNEKRKIKKLEKKQKKAMKGEK